MSMSTEADDIHQAMGAAAWIIFILLLKNVILLIILAYQRRKKGIYRVPEDAAIFNAEQREILEEDWSMAGRIQKVLANETEYLPYFLVLLIFKFCSVPLTIDSNHQYLIRVLVYGISFIIARYLHTAGYLFHLSYVRISGFLLSVLVILSLSVDHVISMT